MGVKRRGGDGGGVEAFVTDEIGLVAGQEIEGAEGKINFDKDDDAEESSDYSEEESEYDSEEEEGGGGDMFGAGTSFLRGI
mmetsp:Transcript_19863/g.55822  ORF Transcript_19863/g.55822 Transcript_19863/m.55822 type:complete len:81 (-) Transcript_19863:760-1002(-)